jgi:TldD protein
MRNGGEYADLFVERAAPLSILCEDDRLEKVVAGREQGAGLRLIAGRRTAYAYTNELTTASLLELADAVGSAVSGVRGTSAVVSLHRSSPAANGSRVRQPPGQVSPEQKAAMVKRANHAARSFDHRVRQVLVTYRENCQEVVIANSEGVLVEDSRNYLTALVHVVAADSGVIQTGYESVGGLTGMELFECEPLEGAAVQAARRAVMMLTAR